MTRQEQMDAKMIIMAEGNDVATGSKWAMLSTSTVIMSKPGVFSWLMEDRLIAGIHYLEVKWDWSDLEEKVRWCLSNQVRTRRRAASVAGKALISTKT
jgi:hypothetical protein